MKIYVLYVPGESNFFVKTRRMHSAYTSREQAERERREILLSTANGPDDVVIEELAVVSDA